MCAAGLLCARVKRDERTSKPAVNLRGPQSADEAARVHATPQRVQKTLSAYSSLASSSSVSPVRCPVARDYRFVTGLSRCLKKKKEKKKKKNARARGRHRGVSETRGFRETPWYAIDPRREFRDRITRSSSRVLETSRVRGDRSSTRISSIFEHERASRTSKHTDDRVSGRCCFLETV